MDNQALHDRPATERPGRIPVQIGRQTVLFTSADGGYMGTSEEGRTWRILRAPTGWRLEFWDPGDPRPTYAGTHPSAWAAQREACR